MKRTFFVIFFSTVMLVSLAAGIAAADIFERISGQQKRIEDGIASRELTPGEAEVLQDNLAWIRKEAERLRRDGRLTPDEVTRLDRMLDRNSAMIAEKKHNPVRSIYKPDFAARIEEQKRRIEQGFASHKLTRREADVLLDNLAWIRKEVERSREGGQLSPAEIDRIERLLDRNSRMIFEKKHNPVRRIY